MRVSKKLLLSFIGFPIGAFIMGIIYLLIYVISGKNTYITQIIQLTNISVFIKELFVVGISMYVAILTYLLFFNVGFTNNNKYKNVTKILTVILFTVLFGLVPIILVDVFLNEITSSIFKLIWFTFILTSCLIFGITDFLNVWIINKKIDKIKRKKT